MLFYVNQEQQLQNKNIRKTCGSKQNRQYFSTMYL